MKTSLKFLFTGIASLAVVTGLSVIPAIAELSDVGPISPETGNFPEWYKDKSSPGLQLDLCVDATDPLCLAAPPPNPDAPVAFPDNFPDEAFWWTASATTTVTPGGAKALLVLATEAAFANGDVFDGDQIVFNRTRIRILGGLIANRKYRITYPYGVKEIVATSKGNKPATINVTEDFGCAVTPTTECNFRDVFAASGSRGRVLNPIGKPWLTWDTFGTTTTGAPPTGYIGDPNVDHKITGSPFPTPTNYFKVELLRNNGTVERQIAFTNLFSVSGKVSPLVPPATTP